MQNSLSTRSVPTIETDFRPYRWQAIRIGQQANHLLFLPSFEGTILAVFSKSIYLSGKDGQILWIAQEHLPMHRRCIRVPFQSHSLRPGQRFSISGSSLWIGKDMVIELDRAEEWNPSIVRLEDAVSIASVNDRMDQLFSYLPASIPDSGFGPAIPILSAIAEGGDLETVSPDPFFTRAIHPIVDITKGCLCEDIVRITQVARELIGLGPGLTPSGDDFIGGLLFALHFLKTIFQKEFFWDDQLIHDLIDWALNRTHPISHAILSDLSSGHGPEPLYDIFNFLLSGGDHDKILLNIDRLCGIGQSSGWDILAGFFTGMLMTRNKGLKGERP